MKQKLTLLLAGLLLCSTLPTIAQVTEDTTDTENVVVDVVEDAPADVLPTTESGRKSYFSVFSQLGLFQSAALEKTGMNRELSYLRFTFGVNVGINYNYEFDEHFGMFVGLGISNFGFTEKVNDSTIKRRVYSIGVPVGVRVGNLGNKKYAILGGGIDMPFNYREKGWVERKEKTKFSEWFSDRTPSVIPFIFAGISFKSGTIVKLQFYPSNFLNTSFEENADVNGQRRKPYRNYDARIVTFSFCYDMPMKKANKM